MANRKGNWRDFGFGTGHHADPSARRTEFEKACKRLGSMSEARVIKAYLRDMLLADIPPDAEDGALRQHLAERRVAQKLALLFAGDHDDGNADTD